MEVTVGVATVGRASVTLGYRVTSASQGGAVVAEGLTVVVLFDYAAKKSVALDEGLRARLSR